jgi:hypothetical protein
VNILNAQAQQAGNYVLQYHFDYPGLYLLQCNIGEENLVQKVSVR